MTGGYGLGRFVLVDSLELPVRSGASCALASHDGHLYLAWTGEDQRLNVERSRDGRVFGGWQILAHSSSYIRWPSNESNDWEIVAVPPTLAATEDRLLLGWSDTDRRLNILNLHGGADSHVVLGDRSYWPPALTTVNGKLALSWTSKRRLYLAYRGVGVLGTPIDLGQNSDRGPAIHPYGSGLVFAWIGGDRRLKLMRSTGGGFGSPVTLTEKSSQPPAICVHRDRVIVSWLGTNRRVNIVELDTDFKPLTKTVLDVKASFGPAMATHDGRLILAWVTREHQVNVGVVSL